VAPFKQTRLMANQKPEWLAKKVGRPTDYRPEFCARVVACMAQGYSLTAFAGEIGHHKAAVYRWLEQFPEFSEAVERGRAARLKAWEKRLMDADKGAQAATSIFALKNSDPEEWREVRYASFDHNVNLNTLDDKQLMAIASGTRPAEIGAIDVQYNRLMERPRPDRAPKRPGARSMK
jgi:hypothetical protein